MAVVGYPGRVREVGDVDHLLQQDPREALALVLVQHLNLVDEERLGGEEEETS